MLLRMKEYLFNRDGIVQRYQPLLNCYKKSCNYHKNTIFVVWLLSTILLIWHFFASSLHISLSCIWWFRSLILNSSPLCLFFSILIFGGFITQWFREIKPTKISSGKKPLDFIPKLSNSVAIMQHTTVTGLKRI